MLIQKSGIHKVLPVMIFFITILGICAVPSLAQTTRSDIIYEEINKRYPDEVQTMNNYGALEDNIKIFIDSFIIRMENIEDLNKENFQNKTANTILNLYLSADHIEVFDAISNGWGLNMTALEDALETGGINEVLNSLPDSFKEIGRLVRKILLPSPDINGDNVVDVYDLVVVAKFNNCNAYQSGIPLGLDQNNDDIINMADLMKVALYFGKLM